MQRVRTILQKAAQRLSLPTDVAAGVPHIQINGFCECSLDRHRGIVEYEPNRIVISVNTGVVTVNGESLQLRQMHRDGLCVCGQICSLEFSGRQ